MAISAVNSLNFNRVAFKGAQAAPKTETANKPQGEDSFLEENKEAIIGLATIGAAVLAGYAAHKTGLVGKIFHKKPTAAAELINIMIEPIMVLLVIKLSIKLKTLFKQQK